MILLDVDYLLKQIFLKILKIFRLYSFKKMWNFINKYRIDNIKRKKENFSNA